MVELARELKKNVFLFVLHNCGPKYDEALDNQFYMIGILIC